MQTPIKTPGRSRARSPKIRPAVTGPGMQALGARPATERPIDPLLLKNPLLVAWRLSFVANRFVFPFYRTLEQEHGVTRPEWVILYCLAQNEKLVAQDVVDKTGLPKNSISRAVSRLIERDFVSRQSDANDRRRAYLSLTADGRGFHDAILPVLQHRQVGMLACLDPGERKQFSELLLRIAISAADWA